MKAPWGQWVMPAYTSSEISFARVSDCPHSGFAASSLQDWRRDMLLQDRDDRKTDLSDIFFPGADAARTAPVHFLHIRKTGGTAIAEALHAVAGRYGIILHDHNTKLSDIPRTHKIVFFVRHPVSRYVSGFYSRLRRGLPRHHYAWNDGEERAFTRFRKANDLAEALTADDPDTVMHAREAMRSIRHINSSCKDWLGETEELDARLDSILLVGLQETLHTDFEYIKKRLGIAESVLLPEGEVPAHRTPAEFDRRLSPAAERNLLEWYAEDLRYYQHCLELRAKLGL